MGKKTRDTETTRTSGQRHTSFLEEASKGGAKNLEGRYILNSRQGKRTLRNKKRKGRLGKLVLSIDFCLVRQEACPS